VIPEIAIPILISSAIVDTRTFLLPWTSFVEAVRHSIPHASGPAALDSVASSTVRASTASSAEIIASKLKPCRTVLFASTTLKDERVTLIWGRPVNGAFGEIGAGMVVPDMGKTESE